MPPRFLGLPTERCSSGDTNTLRGSGFGGGGRQEPKQVKGGFWGRHSGAADPEASLRTPTDISI